MFRVCKLCVPRTIHVSKLKRRMALAKRLLNASQVQSWENTTRERMSATQQAQFNLSGKQKKTQSNDQETTQTTTVC